jgi:hypothetical protein
LGAWGFFSHFVLGSKHQAQQMSGQPRSITDAQLSTCRATPEQDYALEDVLNVLRPTRIDQNQALLETLATNPTYFTDLGLRIKRSAWNGTTVCVAPLADALKFVDIQLGLPTAQKPAAPSLLITEADLKEVCRVTPDGRFSIYDALGLRDDSNTQNARKRFQRFCDQEYPKEPVDGVLKVNPFQKFQFQSEHQATPVAHFHEIMQLFSLVPGPGAANFRAQQFELVRSIYRDGLAAPNPVAVIPIEAKEQPAPSCGASNVPTESRNPVVAMKDLEEELMEVCRVTPDGQISVYDALAFRDDTSVRNAAKKFKRFLDHSPTFGTREGGDSPPFWTAPFQTFQFKSEAPIPVAYFHEIVQLFSLIPGPGAVAHQAHQAELVCGIYRDGLADLALPRNPVASMPLMKAGEEDLKAICRMTPEGRMSVYDALAFRDATSVRNAGRRFRYYFEQSGLASGVDQTNSGQGQKPFETFEFKSEQPTPVAFFHEIMELFALIPGPGAAAYRSQQAQLSTRAMAGDLDLERAVHDRRAALSASAQEVMLAGLESSEDAKRMRAEQFESEQRAKKPRMVYSGEQLVDMVKGLSAVAPNPDLLSEMWEQCDGVRTAFMAQYVKYCEVLIYFCCLV